MDTSRLRLGEVIAGVAGFALLVTMFLHWYSFAVLVGGGAAGSATRKLLDDKGIATSANAWQAFGWLDLLLLITALVAIGLAVLQMTQRTVAIPIAASVLTTALGVLATICVVYRIIDQPGPNEVVNVSLGSYLGLLACGSIAFGGYLSMREEGTAFAGTGPDGGIPAEPAPPRSDR